MRITETKLEKLLTAPNGPALNRALTQRQFVPTPPQLERLSEHLEAVDPPRKTVRLGIVHTYTSELLDPWLHFTAALNQIALNIYHAPYGVTVQEAQPGSQLVAHQPDVTLLLLRREDLHPALQMPLSCVNGKERKTLAMEILGNLSAMLEQFRRSIEGQLVLTLLPATDHPGLGLYDAMAEYSEVAWWQQLKVDLATAIRENLSGTTLLDLDNVLAQVGRDHFFDARLWHSSVFPFAPDGAFAVANAITAVSASLHLTRAKVIVLDADNTLWGGIIGEDGMQGIALGQEYPGSAYVDFQKRILSLQQRGFVLALCSKNNPADLDEVLNEHPHQVLKQEHFAARRVNWQPKPDNLRALAEELNLGLDSFIFVDDSDYEVSAVRHALPEVDVVQVPDKAIEVPSCLESLARLQISSLTEEDLQKTAMYAQEAQRKSQLDTLTSAGGNLDDYLRSLNMVMTVGRDDSTHLARLAQLTQKTNQFNLTTRRYTEADVATRIESDSAHVYHFSLADNFGDSGVVGLAIVERTDQNRARLDTFLMSCRVIGRQAEQAFLECIIDDLRSLDIELLAADYIPTRKNVLVERFLQDNGFTSQPEGYFLRDLTTTAAGAKTFPIDIQGLISA